VSSTPDSLMQPLCDDLAAEHDALDARVAGLSDAQWATATPADGWTIADSISHLAFFDRTATLAATDTDAFAASTQALLDEVLGSGTDPSVTLGRTTTGGDLLATWRAGRDAMVRALRSLDPKTRLPWYGPPMSAASFATARLMETWAHGQDVADALGLSPVASDRLRHIAHIGVRARPFSYGVRSMTMPAVAITVELTSPSGELWRWQTASDRQDEPTPHGDDRERVSGTALDFALAVTQRRHIADTDLTIEGDAAREWMSIAQAFAGAAGTGRAAGSFPRS
jgi:uncharacterized protein (TIGR03084 family)